MGAGNCDFFEVDLLEFEKLYNLLKNKNYDAIFHFAAKSLTAESFVNTEMSMKEIILRQHKI